MYYFILSIQAHVHCQFSRFLKPWKEVQHMVYEKASNCICYEHLPSRTKARCQKTKLQCPSELLQLHEQNGSGWNMNSKLVFTYKENYMEGSIILHENQKLWSGQRTENWMEYMEHNAKRKYAKHIPTKKWELEDDTNLLSRL